MSRITHRWIWFKIGSLIFGVLFFIIFYLVTINSTSTKGYFLRQSMKELDSVKFRHNVVSFQLAIARKQLWDKVGVDYISKWDTKQRQQKTNIVTIQLPAAQ